MFVKIPPVSLGTTGVIIALCVIVILLLVVFILAVGMVYYGKRAKSLQKQMENSAKELEISRGLAAKNIAPAPAQAEQPAPQIDNIPVVPAKTGKIKLKHEVPAPLDAAPDNEPVAPPKIATKSTARVIARKSSAKPAPKTEPVTQENNLTGDRLLAKAADGKGRTIDLRFGKNRKPVEKPSQYLCGTCSLPFSTEQQVNDHIEALHKS